MAPVVFGRKDGSAEEKERFSSEIMTHLDHLYRVAFHLVKNQDEARDFVQETCARALMSYKQFTPGTNMKAWLTRILYNFFFDHYHRSKRTVLVEESSHVADEGLHYWEKVATENPGPEKQILYKELNVKINDALRKIPEEFRVPIILVDMGDLSYAQAAEILACPVGTVRSRLSRGRRLLHKHLRGYVSPSERES